METFLQTMEKLRTMFDEKLPQISLHVQNAERVLVVSHIRPDGDAVGALLGLGLAFEEAGKEVQMVLADGVPRIYRHLEGSDRVLTRPDGTFSLCCVVDSSDLERTGDALDDYGQPDINIDHHVTNLNYAKINLVVPGAVSTTEILAELIPAVIAPISPDIAAALLTGLITDTIGFRTYNMTPRAMRLAADLMDLGADLPLLYQRSLVERSYMATRFWEAGLRRMDRQGGLVWSTLTVEDRNSIGYQGRDDADFINVLSSIDDAEIALVFVEQPDDSVKVSWRARKGYDVSQVALSFGGGGHPAASGAELTGELDEVRNTVLKKTLVLLNHN